MTLPMLKIVQEIPVKFLAVHAQVRYWEDAEVNDVKDTDGKLIPCRPHGTDDCWRPIIELETGHITNWELGKTAKVHYKVCDAGVYELWDESPETVAFIDGYVPEMLSPGGNGYGDYIIMDIDENGYIKNWKVNLKDFEDDIG